MNLDSDIWLADAVRSVAVLRPGDADATAAILWTLGLRLGVAAEDDRPALPAQHIATAAGEDGEGGPGVVTEALPGPEEAERPPGPEAEGEGLPGPEAEGEGLPGPEAEGEGPPGPEAETGDLPADGVLETLEPVTVESGGGMEGWRNAEPLEPVTTRHLEGVAEHDPLLAPGRAGPILAATVQTWDPNGPVDVDRLVNTVAGARPVQRLPRLELASLVRGVQLLVDLGLGMEPFARDQQELADELRRIVGRSGVTELQFRHCPTRGAGTGPVWTWRSYRPPAPGTPVLVLTDLGIGGPRLSLARSQPWEWRALATLLARRASALIAFVPYPVSRFPPGLARSMTIVPWDRTTTISTVRFMAGTGHGSGA